MSTGEEVENPNSWKTLWRDVKYSKKELVENRKVLKTEKKPNKNLLYFIKK
jgi:hypothetical protein